MGPGIAKTALLLVLVLAVTLGVFLVAGVFFDSALPGTSTLPAFHTTHTLEMVYFAAYALAFFGFLAGFTVLLRSHPRGRFSARALLSLVTFAAFTLPLFAAAILKVAGTDKAALSLAAPSPLFVFAMIAEANGKSLSSLGFEAVIPGLLAIGGWAVLGLVLGVTGAARANRQTRAQELVWKGLDDRLAAEDRAQAEAAPPAPLTEAEAEAEAAS
jgi:hypothetical protein